MKKVFAVGNIVVGMVVVSNPSTTVVSGPPDSDEYDVDDDADVERGYLVSREDNETIFTKP